MARHRILHVLGTADLGGKGVCQMVERLAISLDREKYEIEACFLRDGTFTDRFRDLGIRSTCLDWNGAPTNPFGTAKFARLLRSSKFDLVHQHTGGRFLTGIGRILTSGLIVRHVHGRASEETGMVPSIMRLPDRDVTVANSQIVAEACGDPNAIVIYPGIDVSEFRPDRTPGQDVIVGTACRLEPVKGISTLIEAIAIVARDHPSVRLEVAGDGSLRAGLEEDVAKLGLSSNISFLGWREDLASLLQSWSIFVQPSLDEGFGVAALEAMASGLAVIASDVGGLRELVQDRHTGCLVPVGAPAVLAAKIRLLLDDPGLRASMGAAGRQRAHEKFSIDEMVKITVDLYDRLLEPAL